jgi:thioredoxin-dependent peroxiredoxin
VVLGASFDDVTANRAFAEKFSYPFKLLCDTNKSIGKAYDAYDPSQENWARRISYLIGPDRKVIKAYEKVKPAEHPDQVLADLG